MFRTASLFGLALLCGCGDGPAPLPTGNIRAYFPPGGVVDTIEIDAVERLPLREAVLVAPDGRGTAAQLIAARPAPSEGANAPTPLVVGAAAVATRTRLLATLSNAAIRLPEPVAYRRDWQHYRIRLRFGDPPRVDTRELAAPEPPPAAALPPA